MTGFIIIDKEKDITSFKANIIVRGILGEKKTGHSGTLDPMATGVLPIAVGTSTRFIDLLPSSIKEYKASFVLGKTSDTLDITGKITEKTDIIPPFSEIESVINSFAGKIKQLPPMYSAIKKDGVRLYELARKGIEVEREWREIEIFHIEINSHTDTEYTITVKCSQGTYIRTLIDDIGEKLGCGAVMSSLCRTESNGFTLENAYSFSELREKKEQGKLSECVIPTEKAFSVYPALKVSQAQSKRFSNGGELDIERLKTKITPGIYRVYSDTEEFLGLGNLDKNDTALRIKRIFRNE